MGCQVLAKPLSRFCFEIRPFSGTFLKPSATLDHKMKYNFLLEMAFSPKTKIDPSIFFLSSTFYIFSQKERNEKILKISSIQFNTNILEKFRLKNTYITIEQISIPSIIIWYVTVFKRNSTF